MREKDIPRFRSLLMAWYRRSHRKLPWRETDDPYRIWVSEVMLQQTQVKTVLPYYERFCLRFPTVEDLAKARQQSVLKLWEGLGYYARARNLHRAAGMIVSQHGGRIPDGVETIKKLPGVGDYIAAAVLSIAYSRVCPVVDGNVKRVLSRLFCCDTPVNGSSSYAAFRPLAARLISARKPGDYNQATMELGATVCAARNPDCPRCPVAGFCLAFKAGETDQYPKRLPSRVTPVQKIAVGVVFRGNRVLITRRKPNGLLGGLWEFPGGKLRPGEDPEDACVREVREETGISVGVGSYLTRVRHAYTHFRVVVDVYICRYRGGKIALNGPVDHRWIRLDEIGRYPFPRANHKFIPLLRGASQ